MTVTLLAAWGPTTDDAIVRHVADADLVPRGHGPGPTAVLQLVAAARAAAPDDAAVEVTRWPGELTLDEAVAARSG